MMLALRGPEASLNVWYSEKRNVKADLKKLFGEDLRFIDAVAQRRWIVFMGLLRLRFSDRLGRFSGNWRRA